MLQDETGSDPRNAEDRPGLAQLLQRVASSDAVAFRRLYDVVAARLYGIALRIVGEPARAGVVVHDSVVSVWQFAASFDPARGTPEAWLTSIVRHRALDLVRRRGRGHDGIDQPRPGDEELDPLVTLTGRPDAHPVHRCLNRLDEDERRLIGIAFVHGCSHTELAARLGIPLSVVQSTIRRGLASLRECLET
jgi:RNA polymerase sigma-70 factor (ECF subfamily)